MRMQAQAKMDAARAELAGFERGPTPAERADWQARLESARNESKRLSAAIARVERLIDKQAAARSELDELQAAAAVSRLDIASLEAKLRGPVAEENAPPSACRGGPRGRGRPAASGRTRRPRSPSARRRRASSIR